MVHRRDAKDAPHLQRVAAEAPAHGVERAHQPVARLPLRRLGGEELHLGGREHEPVAGEPQAAHAHAPGPGQLEHRPGDLEEGDVVGRRRPGRGLPRAAHPVGVVQRHGHPPGRAPPEAQLGADPLDQPVERGLEQRSVVGVGPELVVRRRPRRFFADGQDRRGVDPAHRLVERHRPAPERDLQLRQLQRRDLARVRQIELAQPRQVVALHPWEQVQRHGREERPLVPGPHDGFAVGLHQPGRHLRNQFVGGDRPDRLQADEAEHLPAQAGGHVGRRAEQAPGAGRVDEEVAVGLPGLDARGKRDGLLEQRAHGLLVARRVRRQDAGVPAQATGAGERHPLAHPAAVGLLAHVVDRRAHRALRRNDHRPAAAAAGRPPARRRRRSRRRSRG